jgi:hypothetical protein
MMQTANARHGDDAGSGRGAPFRPPVCGRFFPQAEVRPVHVIIADVVIYEAFQVVFVEYDHMIEQFATTAANEPFRNAILSRTSETGAFWMDIEAFHCIDHVAPEIGGPIKNQILGSAIVGEGFAQLLRSPCASRVLCDIEMNNSAAVMGDDEEAVEHAKGQRWHSEEVHCSDHFAVVAQKYSPLRGRSGIPGRFAHPAQNSTLGDLEAEHL